MEQFTGIKGLFSRDNHLLMLARRGRYLPSWWVALLMTLAFLIITGVLVGIALFPFFDTIEALKNNSDILLSATGQVIELVGTFAPLLLGLWGWLKLVEKRPFWTLGLEWRGAITKFLRGMLVAVLMFSIIVGMMSLFGAITFGEFTVGQMGLSALGGVLLVLAGWAIQGSTEEILCRGWLIQVFGARYRPWVGIIVSSLIFTILHSLNPGIGILPIINLFLDGIFMAFYALYEKGIWGVNGFHTAWNWIQGNIYGLTVSGQLVAGGMLFNLDSSGPDWLGGGTFGPEGTVVTTVVLAMACLGVLALAKYAKQA